MAKKSMGYQEFLAMCRCIAVRHPAFDNRIPHFEGGDSIGTSKLDKVIDSR